MPKSRGGFVVAARLSRESDMGPGLLEEGSLRLTLPSAQHT